MKFKHPLQTAILIKRYKRFLADITTEQNEQLTIHCPNTGKMTGCAEPGFEVFFSTSDNKKRKYPHTFELAKNHLGHMIGVNTSNANQLVVEAIEQGVAQSLQGYELLQTEVKYGEENSRIDIKLSDSKLGDCYVEVKSTTLLLDADTGLGAFPDAVTTRGQKHIRELMAMNQAGHRAVLVFLVQHTGIEKVTVADQIDPAYAEILQKALQQGVEIVVLHTHIDAAEIKVTHQSDFMI